jgi:hypothetical protein
MHGRAVTTALAVPISIAVIALVAWHHENEVLRETRAGLVEHALNPIAALLNEDEAIVRELQAEPFSEKDASILASYLAKIRRDGVAKHADMKQRLDRLAENNTAIVTLIKAYSPQGKTQAFTSEADKFRNYASAWRDRWNSVMELFMAGGNYPASGVPFPNGFPEAVQAEISATL